MAGAVLYSSRTLQGETMLKMYDSTVRRSIRKFKISAARKTAKAGLAGILAIIIFSVLAFGQQSQKEYLYFNGRAIAVESGNAMPIRYATADFNTDGNADILWRNASTGANYIWYMNGVIHTNGAFLDAVAVSHF
jgi:hypothetical protein